MSHTQWLNLSCKLLPVTGKRNEWSCFYLLRCEIAAVFGRAVWVNVLSEVPLPIPRRTGWREQSVSPRCSGFTVAPLEIRQDLLGCMCAGTCSNVDTNCSDGSTQTALKLGSGHAGSTAGSSKWGKQLIFFFFFPSQSEWLWQWLLNSWLF